MMFRPCPKPTKKAKARKPLGHKRRAAKAASTVTDFDRRLIAASFGGLCGYCGERKAEHWDHRVPISKGGKDEPPNLVPSCAKCNLAKGQATWPMPKGHPHA